jgi:hypothetical protein
MCAAFVEFAISARMQVGFAFRAFRIPEDLRPFFNIFSAFPTHMQNIALIQIFIKTEKDS